MLSRYDTSTHTKIQTINEAANDVVSLTASVLYSRIEQENIQSTCCHDKTCQVDPEQMPIFCISMASVNTLEMVGFYTKTHRDQQCFQNNGQKHKTVQKWSETVMKLFGYYLNTKTKTETET